MGRKQKKSIDEVAMEIAKIINNLRLSYINDGYSEEEADLEIESFYKELYQELNIKK